MESVNVFRIVGIAETGWNDGGDPNGDARYLKVITREGEFHTTVLVTFQLRRWRANMFRKPIAGADVIIEGYVTNWSEMSRFGNELIATSLHVMTEPLFKEEAKGEKP